MKILITGGAGFIGTNFIRYLISKYNYTIVNLDKLTYAGNLDNLKEIKENVNYNFIEGDITDRGLLHEIFEKYSIEVVINFAAESHVDRSIEDPSKFLNTNTLGTQALLDTSLKFWGNRKGVNGFGNPNVKFIQISTDEVYGTLGREGFFSENSLIQPSSPYSASKASADLLVSAYNKTYGLPINITRCSNNYGPYQLPEKLIPMIIQQAQTKNKIPIYGDGNQIRDWLHVDDHCQAIDRVLHNGRIGETYNIGGNNEEKNINLVYKILDELRIKEDLVEFVSDRPGHDYRYAIDNTKINRELGWEPSFTFQEGLKHTINWYLNNQDWTKELKFE
ncbi:spore coat protein [Pontibacillus chungwhensis BH030062]|uniref:dTDP-glucose 4,6-dehydratase n=1 Tax=Pontibacillus chungwhensis BH030062 TaxID=1385513 RepID=A0A0A2UY20_9BACI|nr:dTDP-glucose 4,6-dehydratase [Pontibacillus chungwhensis]KGP91396.1 spore coat protein [Pontibacillus chungwhensis BH030062]